MSCCTLAQTCRGSSICEYIVITDLLCYYRYIRQQTTEPSEKRRTHNKRRVLLKAAWLASTEAVRAPAEAPYNRVAPFTK